MVSVAGLLCALLSCVGPWAEANDDSHTFHIKNAIKVIHDLEIGHPAASALNVIEFLRQASDRGTPPTHVELPLSEADFQFVTQLMSHRVETPTEHGVVLGSDGITVAFAPLLAGIEAGLKRHQEVTITSLRNRSSPRAHKPSHPLPSPPEDYVAAETENAASSHSSAHLCNKNQKQLQTVDYLYGAVLDKSLGYAYLQFHFNREQPSLGVDGCWDNVLMPQVFTLTGPPSQLTNAFINGALDGVILGNYLAQEMAPSIKLSLLLKEYYNGQGLAGQARNRSNFRRQNFLTITDIGSLEEQVKNALCMYMAAETQNASQGPAEDSLMPALARRAVQDFRQYLECPAIIPRCMWEAKPYRGTPTLLKTPLAFVYIHHTYEPSQPCRTFAECAADMRSMQRFHQEDRGWDDIGYNFVVGADGYLYEGRGWAWQGAHTKGYNTLGYGVSFIGDYTLQLPPAYALDLVKDHFLQCAVGAGYLLPGYTIYGHRQLVQTTCPGDALFQEIQTWKGFQEV
ncbi:hypothetical protein NDU88_004811 [Pleurodeles waltl]|uniref:Uncharacterized protein n=2 Tax=Pleurodeles waltl TaxID=8319 RepID=A0AAV7T8V6_PLEWA|nr:hypothetical protein NDU88_004811 [Pleurodeles waltl]